MILIVGAGLAGLTCAKVLHEAGREVLVVESEERLGGRVRTDSHPQGYRLDHGFQVLFTAYPAARRHLDYDALHLRRFDSGALISHNGRRYVLGDPVRNPLDALSSAYSPVATPLDKLLTVLMKYELGRQSVEELLSQDSFTTIEYLRAEGFSERYIEYFLRPFLGGILLNRDLSTSESVFRFVYSMLAKGDVVIPAWGMGEIAEQLANGLPRGAVRCGRRVVALTRSNGKVTGVRTRDEEIEADAVVSAVSAPQAKQLSDVAAPLDEVGCTTLYFATDSPLRWGRKLLLNADSRSFVSHCCSISNVAPNCAPPEKHLLSAVVLGTPDLEDDLIAELALADIDRMSPDSNVKSAELLAIYRIQHAQTAQPPGFRSKLITDVNPEPGLYLAGDYLRSSSINGAMESGEATAHAILAGVPQT